MERPDEWLTAARAAHAGLLSSLSSLTDAQARQPSLLPGWSVGHVLTHLARNADGQRGMFEAAHRSEVESQYPEGASQRERDIQSGAARSASELVADLTAAIHDLESAWASLPDDAWGREGNTTTGPRTLAEIVFRRLREVEVHRVDLGLGHAPADWTDGYVQEELRRQVGHLPQRADAPALVAWMLGRASAPELGSWG